MLQKIKKNVIIKINKTIIVFTIMKKEQIFKVQSAFKICNKF